MVVDAGVVQVLEWLCGHFESSILQNPAHPHALFWRDAPYAIHNGWAFGDMHLLQCSRAYAHLRKCVA